MLRITKANLLPEHLYQYYFRGDSATNKSGAQERREVGYHQSVWKIIDALEQEPTVCAWFRNRYYPEIVNGVIYAWRHQHRVLQKMLIKKLGQTKDELLSIASISAKIKLRCRVLLLLYKLRLL